MATNLTVYVNTTAVDTDRVTNPGNYVQMDLANDQLIFTSGSATVADGLATPNTAELNGAATLIQVTDTEIPTLLLLDFSDIGFELKEINLAGSADNQHVLNFSFDNATASEPTLEAWDDNTHSSAALNVLGLGTPASSMISAVLTTAGSPGASWTGTPIAGGVAPNVLELNAGGGAFLAASEVYANVKIVVPGSYGNPFQENPVLSVRYTFV